MVFDTSDFKMIQSFSLLFWTILNRLLPLRAVDSSLSFGRVHFHFVLLHCLSRLNRQVVSQYFLFTVFQNPFLLCRKIFEEGIFIKYGLANRCDHFWWALYRKQNANRNLKILKECRIMVYDKKWILNDSNVKACTRTSRTFNRINNECNCDNKWLSLTHPGCLFSRKTVLLTISNTYNSLQYNAEEKFTLSSYCVLTNKLLFTPKYAIVRSVFPSISKCRSRCLSSQSQWLS